jgi:hypothetical protein
MLVVDEHGALSYEGDKLPADLAKLLSGYGVKVATAAPVSQDIMTIKHKVTSYAKWKLAHDSGDSARLAVGMHNYVIARGVDDSNIVFIAMHIDSVEKAKAFANNPNMKDMMQKAGVIGSGAEVDYWHTVFTDTASMQQTVRVMIKHKVKDWDTWKKAFDEHKQSRVDAGLTDRVVSYAIGDTHMVGLVFAVSDMSKAKAFMNSKDLADKMKAGGVEGPPSIFFYQVVKKY